MCSRMWRLIHATEGSWATHSHRLCANLSATSKTVGASCGAQIRGISQSSAVFTAGEGVDPKGPKVVIVGGGTAGVTVAAQLLNALKGGEYKTKRADITIVEPSSHHFYQPSWTLVASGLYDKQNSQRPMAAVIPDGVTWVKSRATGFDPSESKLWVEGVGKMCYDYLVVACGLEIYWNKIRGLKEVLGTHGVASVYSYDTCDLAWENVRKLKQGNIIFTQPSTPVKCGGAPQKVMWMAEDHFRRTGVRQDIDVTFATGLPVMFPVPKYNAVLEDQRQQRGVEGLFKHNLVEVKPLSKEAVFEVEDGSHVSRRFDVLHVSPQMGPPEFIKTSEVSDKSGFVSVNKDTLQHTAYSNVFAVGDCSNLPTSKTAAAISTACPVLVHNLLQTMEGRAPSAEYDGYTSCPLLLGYGKLVLAEFKYGLEVKETLGQFTNQAVPRRLFYHLKKDFFPWVYWRYFVTGKWFGPRCWWKPSFPK